MMLDDVDVFSTNLVKSTNDDSKDVWGNQAINYISACIAYVLEFEPLVNQHMGTVRNIINLGEEELKELFAGLPDTSTAKDYFSEIKDVTGQTWIGVVFTATAATRFWKQKRIREFTKKSDFNFTDLGKEKIALYIRVHPSDHTYRPLINIFINQMFSQIISGVDEFGDSYPIQMDAPLDEFTNFGKIEGFSNILTFVRSLGMNLMPFVQDVSQLEKEYGKEDTETIISNCDNFLFLGTNSTTTAKFVSGKLGDTTKRIRADQDKVATDNALDKASQSYSFNKRALLTYTEITQTLPDNQGVYVAKKMRPIVINKVFSYNLFPNLIEKPYGWHLEEKRDSPTQQTNTRHKVVTEDKVIVKKEQKIMDFNKQTKEKKSSKNKEETNEFTK